MQVRKVRCPSCGAPKITSTRSAYVYCDYCARFMDWDVSAAKQGGAPQDPAKAKRAEQKLHAARAKHDRDAIEAAHRAISDQYMTDFPHAYSPRIGDPKYREAMLARTVHGLVVRELDPRCIAADRVLSAAGGALDWKVVGEAATVSAKSFWKMYDAVVAADVALQAAIVDAPQVVPDPDDTTVELSAKIRDSGIAQAWINSLDRATATELLARTHLHDEYEEVPTPALHDAACTQCGCALRAPAGARCTVCEACGHVTRLGRSAFCGFCGAPIEFALGADAASCTHCKAESKLMT